MDENVIQLDGRTLSLGAVERVARHHARVELDPAARERMEASHAVVRTAIDEGRVVYGVTTGFGRLADTRVPSEEIVPLQINLLRSHAVGVGDPFDEPTARAIMLLRANGLAGGRSGVRPVLCEKLLELLNAGVTPRIPCQGSVGASGDLAPLAHLGLVVIGEGEAWAADPADTSDPAGRADAAGTRRGRWAPAAEVLEVKGIDPLELEAKEGLSLVNGTQVMTAQGTLALLGAERLVEAAEVAGALSLEAICGTRTALREEIHAARPHPGQVASAARLRELLGEESEISRSHIDCGRVQDAYSFRCMPQVHGAARDALAYVRRVLETEINAATDNPLVFADDAGSAGAAAAGAANGAVLSGGNFHGAPVAAALDFLAIALADLAAISERRTAALTDPAQSGLPAFLTPRPGLRSGFMMHQVTAAALVSEMKTLAHPASVDTIPTSANREDHVSMGAWAARKAAAALADGERVVAIELLAGAQGMDLRRPLTTSPALEEAHRRLRAQVPPLEEDRPGSRDIEIAARLLQEGAFTGLT